MNRTVLYVSGFSSNLRARDLAYEFERYGRLVRCDIPALKTPTSSPFAFIEFRREPDAEDAYYDMHGRSIDGRRITVQWAKRPPSSAWRHDGLSNDRRDRDADRDRRRSPPPRRRSPSPRRDDRERDGDYDRRRSISPVRDGKDSSRPRDDTKVSSPPPRDADGLSGVERVSDAGERDRDDERERRDD